MNLFDVIARNLVLKKDQVFAGAMILTETKPWYEYKDGTKTGRRLGTQMYVVDAGRRYREVKVKVPIEVDLKEEDLSGEPVFVDFVGFRTVFYKDASGAWEISCSADGWEIVDDEPKKGGA